MEVFNAQEKLNQLTYRAEIEAFNSNLQKGDLGLSQSIDNGYILYGQTRAGKTASGHILSGSPLRGSKTSGQQMVEATSSRNKKAKIGQTMNSETLVPNFFDVKLKHNPKLQGKTCVVDTPGYGDTNGVLTILANGYYHYRLYSKVKNMKFILCFDAIDLKNTGQRFIDTIVQWTASFKDYLSVKKNIWQSCAFLFTKVDPNQYNKEDLVVKLRTFIRDMKTQHEKDVEEALKELITFIINEDRIFYIKKIKRGDTASSGDLLEQIDNKITTWWSRKFDADKNTVDMEPVAFAVSEQIINSTTISKRFRNQFIDLINYYNIRIKQFVQKATENLVDGNRCSLSFVFNELVKDAMGHPDSHKFLDLMSKYVDIYYKKYDPAYKQERQKIQKQIFALNTENSFTQKSHSKFRAKDKNYLVKKFKCIQRIEELKLEICSTDFDQRNMSWLQTCQNNLYDIIRELNRISFKRNKSTDVIYKYGYLIHRIVEEAKVFLLLIQLSGSKEINKRIREQANGQFIDLLRSLKDFMAIQIRFNGAEMSYEELHLLFVKKFSFQHENYKSLVINEPLIDFFTEIDITDQQDSEKLVNLILRYSDQVLENGEDFNKIGNNKHTNKLIKRLTNARVNCEAAFQIKKLPSQKDTNLFMIRKATQNLGKLLQLLGKYKLSREVYDTINFVDSVCNLYRAEIEGLNKIQGKGAETKKKAFELRMEYSKYLSSHLRQNEAVQVLQQSFELASDITQLSEVKEELSDLRFQLKDASFVTPYEKNIFNCEYFNTFNEDLEEQIINMTKNVY